MDQESSHYIRVMHTYQRNRLKSRKESKHNIHYCEICIRLNHGKRRVATGGIHHIYGRYGADAHNPDNILSSCMECHQRIHNHNTADNRELLHQLAIYIIQAINDQNNPTR